MPRLNPLRVESFRLTLLAALGIAPFSACGGSASSSPSGNGGLGGGVPSGGGSANGGASTGGAPNGGTASDGVSNAGASNRFPCVDPRPVKEDLTGSLLECGGWQHRLADGVCAISVPRANALPSQDAQQDLCTTDADCTEKPFGYCSASFFFNLCEYGCEKDADCPSGSLCACGPLTGSCVPTDCHTDQDCEAGLLCASYLRLPGCDEPAFACQTASDACIVDSDCPSGTQCTLAMGATARSCVSPDCVIGRPFLVDGQSRLARRERRGDWSAPEFLTARDALSELERERLGEAWLDIALMEHASIAAFARFTLELLAFGAPSELVSLSNAALADETRHAAQAFALASGYSGHPEGPGALDTALSLGTFELESSVFTAFLEGCIGETVAALEARLGLDSASDPEVCAVLAGIAEDEARHAELAWRFLHWALPRTGADLRGRLLAAVKQSSERAACSESADPQEPVLIAHGVLPVRERARLRRTAIDEIVRPCLQALLQKPLSLAAYNPNPASESRARTCRERAVI